MAYDNKDDKNDRPDAEGRREKGKDKNERGGKKDKGKKGKKPTGNPFANLMKGK
jgi:hypothetical protein